MKNNLEEPGNWLIALDATYRSALTVIEALTKYDVTENIELSYFSEPFRRIVYAQRRLFNEDLVHANYIEMLVELPDDIAELAFDQFLRRKTQKDLNKSLSLLQAGMFKQGSRYSKVVQHEYITELQLPVIDIIAERFEKPKAIRYTPQEMGRQDFESTETKYNQNTLLIEYVKDGGDSKLLLNGLLVRNIGMGSSLQIMLDEVFKQTDKLPLKASVPDSEKKNINTKSLINNSLRMIPAPIRSRLFKSKDKGSVLLVTPSVSYDTLIEHGVNIETIESYLNSLKK